MIFSFVRSTEGHRSSTSGALRSRQCGTLRTYGRHTIVNESPVQNHAVAYVRARRIARPVNTTDRRMRPQKLPLGQHEGVAASSPPSLLFPATYTPHRPRPQPRESDHK